MVEINKTHCMDNVVGMSLLSKDSIDLVFTSPPYFNARKYSHYGSIQEYMLCMEKSFSVAYEKLKPSRMCVVNVSPIIVPRESRSKQSYRIPIPFYFVPMMESIGYEFLEDIIWKKPDGSAVNRNGKFFSVRKPVMYKPNIVTEYVLVFKKPAPFLIDKILKDSSLVPDGYERTNIWEINPENDSSHPAPFPEGLADRVIRYYSYEGDLVLDPFMGSGTTAKVSKDLGRNFLGFDISQEYVDMANMRVL